MDENSMKIELDTNLEYREGQVFVIQTKYRQCWHGVLLKP